MRWTFRWNREPLGNGIDDNNTAAQKLVPRNLGFDPQLHILRKRLWGTSGSCLVDDIRSSNEQ